MFVSLKNLNMKTTVTLVALIIITFNLNGQISSDNFKENAENNLNVGSYNDKIKKAYPQFSNGIYYGFHGSLSQTSINTSTSNALLINTRLFIRPSFGIIAKFGFDQFRAKESQLRKSNYSDICFDVFYDLGNVLGFQEVNITNAGVKKESNFKLLLHGGPGVSSMWNDEFTSPNASDPLISNHDDIVNFSFGISPELKFSNHFSVGIDFSAKFNYYQNRSFNYAFKNESKQAKMYAVMVGLNYYY
jgi:hypothetical protein